MLPFRKTAGIWTQAFVQNKLQNPNAKHSDHGTDSYKMKESVNQRQRKLEKSKIYLFSWEIMVLG